jgi:hypothetical protein
MPVTTHVPAQVPDVERLVPEPLSIEHAVTLLHTGGVPVGRVVRVDGDHHPESVLYLDEAERAMTAWLWRGSGSAIVRTEPGFAAEPAAGPGPEPHPILDADPDLV